MTQTVDPRIIKARGLTADAFSVHVVTVDPNTGEPARVASFAGSGYEKARARMWQHYYKTRRHAWLVRGTSAAFLPFPTFEPQI